MSKVKETNDIVEMVLKTLNAGVNNEAATTGDVITGILVVLAQIAKNLSVIADVLEEQNQPELEEIKEEVK